ncbi:MAG: ribonuclease HI [Deinococcales bacterium]
MSEIIIYTDGGCEPNPGPGGYGAVLLYKEHRRELSGGFKLTTNNRMELYAAVMALESLKRPCGVKLHSDSGYLVNAFSKGWIFDWQRKNWRVKNDMRVNFDLWQRLFALNQKHQIEFIWVKGHAGILENERCDELAMLALRQTDLDIDEGYSP